MCKAHWLAQSGFICCQLTADKATAFGRKILERICKRFMKVLKTTGIQCHFVLIGSVALSANSFAQAPPSAESYQPASSSQVQEFNSKLKTVNEGLQGLFVDPLTESLTIGIAPGLTGMVPTVYGAPPVRSRYWYDLPGAHPLWQNR